MIEMVWVRYYTYKFSVILLLTISSPCALAIEDFFPPPDDINAAVNACFAQYYSNPNKCGSCGGPIWWGYDADGVGHAYVGGFIFGKQEPLCRWWLHDGPCPSGQEFSGPAPGSCKSLRSEFYAIKLSRPDDSFESNTILDSIEPSTGNPIGANIAILIAKVYDQNNQLVSNVDVQLVADVMINSGGHQHDDDLRHTKHMGTLAPVSPSTGTITQNGKILKGNTQQDGLRFSFTPPAPAGDHKITASCIDGKNCTQEGPDTIWVGVKNLHSASSSQNYVLISPNRDANHPGNHYLLDPANAALEELAYRYHIEFPNSPVLHLNDSSLERGGVFDISYGCPPSTSTCSSRPIAWWTSPHSEHRRGVVIDIRANGTSTAIPLQNYGKFKAIANSLYMNVKDETDLGHFHVRLLGIAQ